MAKGYENKWLGFTKTNKATSELTTHYLKADNILYINWVDATNTEIYVNNTAKGVIKCNTNSDTTKAVYNALMTTLFALGDSDENRIVADTPLINTAS